MHNAYQATLNITTASFDMLRDVLADLPDEALQWKPEGAGNTIQVLTTHSITATRFWLQVGCGIDRSLKEYREGEREDAFAGSTNTAAQLNADIDVFLAEFAADAAQGTDETLNRETHFTDVPDQFSVTGFEAILRALGHLREHVGEAQLMRDLWKARK